MVGEEESVCKRLDFGFVTGTLLQCGEITHVGHHPRRQKQGKFLSCLCRSSPNLWTDKVVMTSFLWLMKKVSACLIVAFFLLVFFLLSSIPCWTFLVEIQIIIQLLLI